MRLPADIDPKHEALIIALLNSKTNAEAAKQAGIPRSTMYRWLNDPAFMAAYRNARRLVFDEAIATLQKGSCKAAQMLVDRLESEQDGIRAGRAIFEFAFKYREFVELEERFADMEAKWAQAVCSQQTTTPTPVEGSASAPTPAD